MFKVRHSSCLWVDICFHLLSGSQALRVLRCHQFLPSWSSLILGYPARFILSSAKQGLLSCPEHPRSEKTHTSQNLSENGWCGRVLESKHALSSGGGTSPENADTRNRACFQTGPMKHMFNKKHLPWMLACFPLLLGLETFVL